MLYIICYICIYLGVFSAIYAQCFGGKAFGERTATRKGA